MGIPYLSSICLVDSLSIAILLMHDIYLISIKMGFKITRLLLELKYALVRGQTGSVVERQRYWSYMFFVGLGQFFSDAPN